MEDIIAALYGGVVALAIIGVVALFQMDSYKELKNKNSTLCNEFCTYGTTNPVCIKNCMVEMQQKEINK